MEGETVVNMKPENEKAVKAGKVSTASRKEKQCQLFELL